MISDELLEAIKILTIKLKGVRLTLIVSANLAVHGIEINPKDIYVLTDSKEITKIKSVLKEYEKKLFSYGEKGLFKSYLAEYKINKIKVEIMADFEVKRKNKWISLSDRLNNLNIIKLNVVEIPVSSLDEQLKGYKKLGRDKDKLKIKLIEDFLIKCK